jgi:inner membrane protein
MPHYRNLITAGLLCSVLPDMDLLHFYFIDNRQHMHHGYMFHLPAFWTAIVVASLLMSYAVRSKSFRLMILVCSSNILIHFVLDSVTEGIAWLYPLTNDRFGLFNVPARFGWWVWSFMFHWTFLLEVAIVFAAWRLWFLTGRKERSGENRSGGDAMAFHDP